MASRRSGGLQSLIKIAENAVNEAMGYMGSIQKKIEAEKEKEKTLIQYEADYQAVFLAKGQQGVHGTAIEQHEAFMGQIEQALDHQSNHVHQLKEQLEQAREVYNNLNQKLKIYQKLEQRMSDQALRLEAKKVQNQLDEIAIQMHLRRE